MNIIRKGQVRWLAKSDIAGQVAFLEGLQRRPAFFATDYFHARFEAGARENLNRLLALRIAEGFASPKPT